MNIYLVAAFVLLLVMLWLVLRPFLFAAEPALATAGATTDAGATARSVAKVERVRRPARAARTATAVVVADSPEIDDSVAAETVAEPTTTATDDVRASVEAVIAARKAALRSKHCASCDAAVEIGDAFCRSCGTKVTA